jgi:hypothetical protein
MNEVSSRKLLKEIRKGLDIAKQQNQVSTNTRILTLVEAIVLYLELRRKPK